MDDTMLAFMVFATSRPEALSQIQARTDAEALEAGEALPDLREAMAVQILSAEAEAQRKSLAKLVDGIFARPSSSPMRQPMPMPPALKNTTGCEISTRHLGFREIVNNTGGRIRPYNSASRRMRPHGCITTYA